AAAGKLGAVVGIFGFSAAAVERLGALLAGARLFGALWATAAHASVAATEERATLEELNDAAGLVVATFAAVDRTAAAIARQATLATLARFFFGALLAEVAQVGADVALDDAAARVFVTGAAVQQIAAAVRYGATG